MENARHFTIHHFNTRVPMPAFKENEFAVAPDCGMIRVGDGGTDKTNN
jgi:hypothetical protein